MAELAGVTILIGGSAAERTLRRAEMLREAGATVWTDSSEVPQDGQPEILLADGGPLPEPPPGEPNPDVVGVIRIAAEGPADVRLPGDVTDRELRLACRLLAQIVRLRRRQHEGAQLQRRLAEQSLRDPLTGLPNRRAWDRAVDERLAAVAPPGLLCLAVVDLDHFKRINDTHGHAVGDAVLRAAADALCGELRQGDFVARFGGDEFGLLLWVPDGPAAAAAVDRVRASLPAALTAAEVPSVTASAGHATTSDRESNAAELYAAADAAMHAAKRRGRNRTV